MLTAVVRDGSATQIQIARRSGLSQQSVSRLVSTLTKRGALMAGTRFMNGGRGQPSVAVRPNPDYAHAIGVALMTDAMSVVFMNFAGRIVDFVHVDLPAVTRPVVFLALADIKAEFARKHDVPGQGSAGVGVGISGYCLDGISRYNTPRALDDWAMVDIAALFKDALGLPTWVENDGNAAAIGESLLGAGREYANFIYMFVDAGIGGGVILDHKLARGRHGNGGELGLILPHNIYKHPTLETLRQTLVQRGVVAETVSSMLARFDPEWPGVDEWIEQTREPFSLIASAIAAIVDPDAIVVGGRMPTSLAAKLIPHIEIYEDMRRAERRPLPRIISSRTTVDACAVGAAALVLEKRFLSEAV